MTHVEAYNLTTHPGRDRFLWQAREGNEDIGQRDAARMTLLRLAGAAPPMPAPKRPEPPTPEDVTLRALVAMSGGCCGH